MNDLVPLYADVDYDRIYQENRSGREERKIKKNRKKQRNQYFSVFELGRMD